MTPDHEPTPSWQLTPGPGLSGSVAIGICARYAERRFAQLKVSSSTPNRLQRARQALEALRGVPPEPADLVKFRDATRTIHDQYYIARALRGDPAKLHLGLKKQLARMLGGPDLAQDEDHNSSQARNVQFELLVGAWLTSGGARVRSAEPDLRVMIGDEDVGVAVKRVRSKKRLSKRLNEAVAQIEKSPGRGIIAICVDSWLDELPLEANSEELGAQFDRSFPEFDAHLDRLSDNERVYGLLAIGTRAGWDLTSVPPSLHFGTFTKFRTIARRDNDAEVFRRFWDSWQALHAKNMGHF